eukprot:Pompholyxophrys_punicea_v1_NODE_431_length_1983_cov_58.871369.p1 type:complete len:370 gc:universal NODE_431_length_1983_cov_58.871369:1252-143(-)
METAKKKKKSVKTPQKAPNGVKNKSNKNSTKQRFKWNDETIEDLVVAYKGAQKNGYSAGTSGLKTKGWNFIEQKMRLAGHDVSSEQLKNIWQKQKSIYKIYRAIIENSGFGIDPVTKAPTAADHIWDHYIAAHPKAGVWRNKVWKLYETFHGLFGGVVPTGETIQSISEVTKAADEESQSDESIEEEENSGTSAESGEESEDEMPEELGVKAVTPNIASPEGPPKKKHKVILKDESEAHDSTSEKQSKKKMTSADKLSEAITKLRAVPPLEQAVATLWKVATPTEAVEIQKLFIKDPSLASIFNTMPSEPRKDWIKANLPTPQMKPIQVVEEKASSLLENAFELLFALPDLSEETKMKVWIYFLLQRAI